MAKELGVIKKFCMALVLAILVLKDASNGSTTENADDIRTTEDLSTTEDLVTIEDLSTIRNLTESVSTQEDTTYGSTMSAFGDWSDWGSCSSSCGSDITQNRTKYCKPDMICEGTLGESQSCEDILCQDALENGIEIILTGLTKSDFDIIAHIIQAAIAEGMNNYCTFNTSTAQECCLGEDYINRTHNTTFVNKNNSEIYAFGVVGQASTRLVIVASIWETNAQCSSSYKRYSNHTMILPRTILKRILGDPNMISNIRERTINSAKILLNKNITVTVGIPTLPSELLYMTTTQGLAMAQTGVPSWVIAVAVVGSVLAAVTVVSITAFVMKQSKKVAPSDHLFHKR